MFAVFLPVALLVFVFSYLHRLSLHGQRSYGDLEFSDDHSRIGPRDQLLAHFVRQNKWWALGTLAGSVVGAAVALFGGFGGGGVAVAGWLALTAGLFAKCASAASQSKPARAVSPIEIPLLWKGLVAASGLLTLLMPTAIIVTGQREELVSLTVGLSALAVVIMGAAHGVQWWVRRRDFLPFTDDAWNYSVRTLFVAHMLIAACLAGFASCLLAAYLVPQTRGFANSKPAVQACIWGVVVPFVGLILVVVGARGLRRRLHTSSH